MGNLITDLIQRFPTISLKYLKPDFYEYDEKVIKDHIPGIWAHTTVRVDKSDIYPDKRIIQMIESLIPSKETSNNTKPKKPKA